MHEHTNVRSRRPGFFVLTTLALVLLLHGTLVLNGCASRKKMTREEIDQDAMKQLEEIVYGTIAGQERAEQVLTIYEESVENIQSFRDLRREYMRRFMDLNWDYHAARSDFEALFTEYDRKRRLLWENQLRLDKQLRGIISNEEYRTLKKKEGKLVKKVYN